MLPGRRSPGGGGSIAYGMLGDVHRVDDVLQEAFLKAYSHLPDTFADDRHESAWLVRIVHRCCLD